MTKILVFTLLVLASSFGVHANELSAKKMSIEKYSDYVYATYADAHKRAVTLNEDIKNFVKNPSVITMEIAKKSWKTARAPYGNSEVFRFYNGPIDRDGGPEGLLNAWPLDEAYIDYVIGLPSAGIINNKTDFPEITKELLSSLNELDGEKNISTGYHAIEFLLWGQDLYVDSAGRRPYTDYVEGVTPNADRRAHYLLIASEMLVEHLASLEDEWVPNKSENFRAQFLKQDVTVSLKNIFNGVVFMAGDELSGERMYVAYETMGQEDEHSCFSDMTHMDIRWNYEGLENVINKTGLLEIGSLKNSTLAKDVKEKMKATRELLASIPVPFDQAILNEDSREIILASVESLEELAAQLVKVASELGVEIDY